MSNVMNYFGSPNPRAVRIPVYYEGTNTIYEGMPVCYNYDTTTNKSGYNSGTTAEGSQNEGKYWFVEDPASGNLNWFAGVVAPGSHIGETGPRVIDIYIPNGAVVPVRVKSSVTIGDALGLVAGQQYMQVATGDGDPMPCAIVDETYDRSSTAGVLLAKVFETGRPICGVNSYFTVSRGATTGYEYGVNINGDALLTGGAASKSYVLNVSGDRESGNAATGDSNDALLKITGNNYAKNDTNFIFRGLNASINNRDGGVLGRIEHSLGSQGKSGGTVNNIVGLSITAENYGTVSDMFGGLDVLLKNEGAVATTEYGIRIRNENNSIADAVAAAVKITDSGANTGFDYFLDCYGASAPVVAAIRLGQTSGEDIVITFGEFTDGADSGFAPGSIGLDTTNGLLFYCDSAGLWQQIAAA